MLGKKTNLKGLAQLTGSLSKLEQNSTMHQERAHHTLMAVLCTCPPERSSSTPNKNQQHETAHITVTLAAHHKADKGAQRNNLRKNIPLSRGLVSRIVAIPTNSLAIFHHRLNLCIKPLCRGRGSTIFWVVIFKQDAPFYILNTLHQTVDLEQVPGWALVEMVGPLVG